MKVKDLKVGDKFARRAHNGLPYRSGKIEFIHRIFMNSYLIDTGTSLFELDGETEVEVTL